MKDLLARHGTKVAWGLFALLVAGVLGYALKVHLASPFPKAVNGEPDASGRRFGMTEEERRRFFLEVTRGEPSDRQRATREREGVVWIRNHDDYFHELEAQRVAAHARRARIPMWQAHLIIDEGLRAHWPPAPGVELRADDAPMIRFTRPLKERPVIVASPAAPAAPPGPPPAAPAPAAAAAAKAPR